MIQNKEIIWIVNITIPWRHDWLNSNFPWCQLGLMDFKNPSWPYIFVSKISWEIGLMVTIINQPNIKKQHLKMSYIWVLQLLHLINIHLINIHELTQFIGIFCRSDTFPCGSRKAYASLWQENRAHYIPYHDRLVISIEGSSMPYFPDRNLRNL